MPIHRSTLVGLDIGKRQDYTALAVVEREQWVPALSETGQDEMTLEKKPRPAIYHVRHLERLPLGTLYTAVAEYMQAFWPRVSRHHGRPVLLADRTGVGDVVVDLLRKVGLWPQPVLVHWGMEAAHWHGDSWHVPKAELVGRIAVLSEGATPRLRLGERLPFAREVRRELQSFRADQNRQTGYISYEAYREQDHDDLVYALAMIAWWGETWGNRHMQYKELWN